LRCGNEGTVLDWIIGLIALAVFVMTRWVPKIVPQPQFLRVELTALHTLIPDDVTIRRA
jgi:MFS superfamily sulfate permease-like transporter